MSKLFINVTQPALPPLDEFIPYLQQIWSSHILTNGGPMHQALEKALCDYLEVPFICLFNNGTSALFTALQALGVRGEVITTPYSFVATANVIVQNGLKPVFVDIDPETLNLDPHCIEAAITSDTAAILPVHCYGRPCDVAAIDAIAKRHGLPVIYDAAHAFAVRHEGRSVLEWGDLSILSFHATKVFHTFEGGAIVCHSLEMKERIDQLKNFGYIDECLIEMAGLNGKMNEVCAAMGLLQLRYVDQVIARRRQLATRYQEALAGLPGLRLIRDVRQTENQGYFPILVEDDFPLSRDALYERLWIEGIRARRYFYPLITDFQVYRDLLGTISLQHARQASERVICLPLFPALSDIEVESIISIIYKAVQECDARGLSCKTVSTEMRL